ncbi:hypothetical protein CF326_g4635 [Tilletia indica]|nr:hypothetical protein CF326_g4635 [Tilletia indica]
MSTSTLPAEATADAQAPQTTQQETATQEPAGAAVPASQSGPSSSQRKEACYWSPSDDEKLLDVLEEAKAQGKASGGGFKLKSQWKEVRELVNMSGFGWDDEEKKVTAEDTVWDDLIKRRPELRKWRNRAFIHYSRLRDLNAKSTATGEFARDAGAGGSTVDEDGDESETESSDSDDAENEDTSTTRKRKRPSAVTAMADIATALKGMGSHDEGLSEALTALLDRDSESFDEDELTSIGLALADNPRLASVYLAFAEKPQLREKVLRKILSDS